MQVQKCLCVGLSCLPCWSLLSVNLNYSVNTTFLFVSSGLDAFNVTDTFANVDGPDRNGEMQPMDIFDYSVATNAITIPREECIGKWTGTFLLHLASK